MRPNDGSSHSRGGANARCEASGYILPAAPAGARARPESRKSEAGKRAFPTARKLRAGIVKSFPTGRKMADFSIDIALAFVLA